MADKYVLEDDVLPAEGDYSKLFVVMYILLGSNVIMILSMSYLIFKWLRINRCNDIP